METSTEQLSSSGAPENCNPEEFTSPEPPSLSSLTDGRKIGDFVSVYPNIAWVQIIAEFVYLIAIMLAAFYALAELAIFAVKQPTTGFLFDLFGPAPANLRLIAYASIALAGACGGCTASLKWLYHTVAKNRWHRDRLVCDW